MAIFRICTIIFLFSNLNLTTVFIWKSQSEPLSIDYRKYNIDICNINYEFLPSREITKSIKQVVTAPLRDARQHVRVKRVLGDINLKRVSRVTVGVAFTVQWP